MTHYDIMGREINVAILGLLHGRPDEAAEVMLDLDIVGSDDTIFPTSERDLKLMARTLVGRVMTGTNLMVHVKSQKDLNALAGYFWVEPRRLTN
jgi:hypothetical protein